MKKKAAPKDDQKPRIHQLPKPGISGDPDDLVHSKEEDIPRFKGQEDPDDLVHGTFQPTPLQKNSLEDPDDLVHGFREEPEE